MNTKRFVSVIIMYDNEKKILLQHRDEDIIILPGYWSFFGGAIDNGESPEDAVIRETKEELEYTLTEPRLIMKQTFSTEIHDVTRYIYIEKYNPNHQLILHEGQGMDWHKFSDVSELKIDKFDLEVIKFAEKKI